MYEYHPERDGRGPTTPADPAAPQPPDQADEQESVVVGHQDHPQAHAEIA
jgi:hypothetical protein